jgi:hypothetical protein
MSGLKQRLSRRSAPGSQDPDARAEPAPPAGGRLGSRSGEPKRPKWGKRAEPQAALPAPDVDAPAAAPQVVEVTGGAGFRDRGTLRRRLRYLRRARELAFRDVGGLIFDLRRFGRDRPDLVEAKLTALGAVDQELRALERVLDDRRPIHELREPGLSSCPRCGALHGSEDNFCPRCGLQMGGPQAMGEVGGAIAAPPQAPAPPLATAAPPSLFAPRAPDAPAPASTPPLPAPYPPARAPAPAPRYPADEQQTEIYRPPDAT